MNHEERESLWKEIMEELQKDPTGEDERSRYYNYYDRMLLKYPVQDAKGLEQRVAYVICCLRSKDFPKAQKLCARFIFELWERGENTAIEAEEMFSWLRTKIKELKSEKAN